MNVHITKIGNSRGLRLPQAVINQYHLSDGSELKLRLEKDGLVLKPIKRKPAKKSRTGWAEQLTKIAQTQPEAFSLGVEDKEWLEADGGDGLEDDDWSWLEKKYPQK